MEKDKLSGLPEAADKLQEIKTAVAGVIVGQQYLVDRMLIALICNQHILLEGVPGLAKSLSVTTFAGTLGLDFHRIQFTPDLLPADITGTLVYNPKSGEFSPRKGPVFSNIILADEINRAPAKVQSALLEAMQERQVTIGDATWPLDNPFLVMATQNPVEQEGTYPLPEAQTDRFMLKVVLDYPDRNDELEILRRRAKTTDAQTVPQVASISDILELRKCVDTIHIEPSLEEYIVDIVQSTRKPALCGLDIDSFIRYGASPRATLFLTLAAKAKALLGKRDYVVPADIIDIAKDVLRHRVMVSYEGEAEQLSSDILIDRIMDAVKIP